MVKKVKVKKVKVKKVKALGSSSSSSSSSSSGSSGSSSSSSSSSSSGHANDGVQIVMEDAPAILSAAEEVQEKASDLMNELAEPLLHKIDQGLCPTDKGVSFLELKHKLLLHYCQLIAFYVLKKTRGETVVGHPCVRQLLEVRTTLERMRPLDAKLHYRLTKLFKLADGVGIADGASDSDPLYLRPKPEDMVTDDQGEGGESGGATASKKTGVYQAPRFSSTPYEEQEKAVERRAKALEKAKKRAGRSELLRELREEMSTAPTQVDHSGFRSEKNRKLDEERTKFEENNFRRLQITKKDKQRRRANEMKASKFDSLASLSHAPLTALAALGKGDDDGGYEDALVGKKFGGKRKSSSGSGKKGKRPKW